MVWLIALGDRQNGIFGRFSEGPYVPYAFIDEPAVAWVR
jgi:hypothetical protein